jgi:Rrf2 family protein
MISQTAEYALRIVVFLATLKGEAATTRQIAAATRVPEGYLAKIIQGLSRARIVRSQRGLHGGSVLAHDPANLSVYDVIQAVSPLQRIRSCPLELPSHGTSLCPLHRRLDDAAATVEQAFRQSTIAELIAEPTTSIPLGELPGNAQAATRAAETVFAVSGRRGRASRPMMPTITRKLESR